MRVRVNEQPSAPSPRRASPSYDTNAQGHAVLSEANVARLGSKRRAKARSLRQDVNGGHPLPEPVPASAGDMARELTDS